ncbi:MAG: FAD-binding protein [Armatimonadetes bacterium]|nr:FAD-binding protein [Armatimonadota bacterium]
METVERLRADCVVVGGGGAGLRAAVEARAAGLDTILVLKSVLGQSHTLMAEGGVNAAIGQIDESDDWKAHYDDTIEAGRFINHKGMVEALCRESPARMEDLYDFGAGFEKDARGRLVQADGHSGGQTRDRVISQGDFIGFIMQRALMAQALKAEVRFIDETIAVKLLRGDGGEAAGVLGYSLKKGCLLALEAPRVVLACGGGGHVFGRTTNPVESTGEGYLLGFDAGLELRDMEMTQFHPTGLCWPPSGRGILVTEACRAMGGKLYNARGERFMERYDRRLELAPRDVVTRAIVQELEAGRGCSNGGVMLDLTEIDAARLLYFLNNTARVIKSYQDIDITREPFEVRPSAHHFMGGLVARDVDTMEALPGVFLAGEIAWGTHGANRLGGNSLAETQVFGRRAGAGAVQTRRPADLRDAAVTDALAEFRSVFESDDSNRTTIYQVRRGLGEIMDGQVGVIRSEESLRRADRDLEALRQVFAGCRKAIDNYHSVAHIFECDRMLTLARVIIAAALARRESRGAHFRSDFPEESARRVNTSQKCDRGFQANEVEVP